MPTPKMTTEQMLEAYERGDAVNDIAARAGTSRQTVRSRLKALGVERRSRHVACECRQCGRAFQRYAVRVVGAVDTYCSNGCYWASRTNPAFVSSRQGQRRGREALRRSGWCFAPGEVVHHKDGDQLNNELSNLCVFASASDHMRHHHGVLVEPVYDPGSGKGEAQYEGRAGLAAGTAVRFCR